MPDLSLTRLYLMRAAYLVVAVGLVWKVWPAILFRDQPWELMQGVVVAVLAAVSLLAMLGLRYPVRLLPLLLFELLWKSIWLIRVALPLGLAHQIDDDTAGTVSACLFGVIFLIVIPWPYVVRQYLLMPGDRWR